MTLPKSIRTTEATHSKIQNKKIYEVIDEITEKYVQGLSVEQKELVESIINARSVL